MSHFCTHRIGVWANSRAISVRTRIEDVSAYAPLLHIRETALLGSPTVRGLSAWGTKEGGSLLGPAWRGQETLGESRNKLIGPSSIGGDGTRTWYKDKI